MVKAQSSIEYIYLIGGVLIVAFIAVILMLSLVGDEPIFVMPFTFNFTNLPGGGSSFDSGEILIEEYAKSDPSVCGGKGLGCEGGVNDDGDDLDACNLDSGGDWELAFCYSGESRDSLKCELCDGSRPVEDCPVFGKWACTIDGRSMFSIALPLNAEGELYMMVTAFFGQSSSNEELLEVTVGGENYAFMHRGVSSLTMPPTSDGVEVTSHGTTGSPVLAKLDITDTMGNTELDVRLLQSGVHTMPDGTTIKVNSIEFDTQDPSWPCPSCNARIVITVGGNSQVTDDLDGVAYQPVSTVHRCIFENPFTFNSGDSIRFQSFDTGLQDDGGSIGIMSYRLFGIDKWDDVIADTDDPKIQTCEDWTNFLN